jgi:predicted PurR-regulated permease PerM
MPGTTEKPFPAEGDQQPLLHTPRTEPRDPSRTIAHILRATFIIVGAAALIWAMADAFLVVFLSILFAVMLRGLGSELHRRTRLPITLSVLLVFLVLIALVFGFGYWVGPRLAAEGTQLWQQVSSEIGRLQTIASQWGLGSVAGGGSGAGAGNEITSAIGKLPHMLALVASSTASFLATVLVVAATAAYLAAAPDTYITGTVHLTPLWYQHRTRQILMEMGAAMRGWLLGQFIDMVVVGVLIGVGLWLLGVPLSLALGVLAGVLTFVPYFGTIVSAIPSILIGLTVSPRDALWVLCLFLAAHGVEGYMISPFVQRRTIHMPPALTVLAMVLLTAFFGILGVLIATPLVAVAIVGVTRVYVEDVLGDTAGGAKMSAHMRA